MPSSSTVVKVSHERRTGVRLVATVIGLASIGASSGAQQPLAISGDAAVLAPSSRLGGSSLTGWAASVGLPLGEWTSLEASAVVPSTVTVGDPGRQYTVVLPSLAIRTELTEGRLPIALSVGGGLLVYRLRGAVGTTIGSAPASTNIPAAQVGLGTHLRIWPWLAADLSVRDWLTVVRQQQLVQPQGARVLTQVFDFRVGLALHTAPRAPGPPRPTDAPIAYVAQALGAPHETGSGPAPAAGDGATLASPSRPTTERTVGAVYFAIGSADVATEYRPVLEHVAQELRGHRGATLRLLGYADLAGGLDPNASLAERRATAVADLLVRLYGVDPHVVSTMAMGIDYRATDPVSARRTELRMIAPEPPQP